ncbi:MULTISPECIES: sigma E protease regulator RseP [unclassified Salinivibrio]|uniref:sigma E protease regulator RseP n=1 Tax=unclassified Salinivibrio TaxID=2636825 RepID=UPI00084BC769|nr:MULTISPECIES: sigma E protease regulator RseP [unclassified Salinivibrio]ODQ00155.1 RIP metalloprotease RseP [Salinivibrio sp. DV]OOF27688.1 RIP metalloprotease RseP [Salinivibrio sp. IB872]PCE69072.1 RIP metalloprotease RseP [Salinivibrio sp. YCSC6]QCF36500.1 sigma E protease regulator RseP [Salinivibrio sp. YCSC6]
MSAFLWNAASFIVALGVLVAIHEYGHFWVARRCGVKVERFSIGFGRALWRWRGKDDTEYVIAAIPLGGYVKMLDERIEAVAEHDKPRAFNNQPLWQRSAIVAAGPIANFLFAVVAYWLIFMMGIPAVKPVIGQITPNSIAAEAGIEPGMELTHISGVETADWQAVNFSLINHIGDEQMTMTAKPDVASSYSRDYRLDLTAWQFNPETESPLTTLGITPYRPAITLDVAQVVEGSAAAKAGIASGDTLVAIDGNRLQAWSELVEAVQASPNQPLQVTVTRAGREQVLNLTPDARESNGKVTGYAGIAPQMAPWPEAYRFTQQYGPLAAIPEAVSKTGQVISLTVNMVKKLIVGDVGVNNLSGPISIAKGAGMTAEIGLISFLGFMALISVNLGIINLLPLPVLDGGHLLFFGIEAVTRRPVPERVQDFGYRIGAAVLMMVMAVALFNDFARL